MEQEEEDGKEDRKRAAMEEAEAGAAGRGGWGS
jgi:hypothetical protein